MKIVVLVARMLLGLLFVVSGVMSFVLIGNPPPSPPGLAGEFMVPYFASHWVLFVASIQIIAGVLLVVNRYVPLALIMLAAVLYNILAFHVTMQPAGIGPALIATALWFLIAWPLRRHFASLLSAKNDE